MSRNSSNISFVNQNGVHIEDPTEMANTLNSYFANVAAKVKRPVTHSNHNKLKDLCDFRRPDNINLVYKAILKNIKV